MNCRRGLIPILAAGAILACPAGAGAAEVVGSDLAATPNSGPAVNTTRVQTAQPTGVTLPLTPTASGVIVLITLKHGAGGPDPGAYGFRPLSGALPDLTARTPAELADFVPPANAVANTVTFTPTVSGAPGGTPKGIPIEAGERVGIVRIGGTAGDAIDTTAMGVVGAERHFVTMAHNSGTLTYSGPLAGDETTMQYLVEPDSDGDGFGDETQDLCSTNAATQAACPAPPVTAPITTSPAPTATKKCKKPKKKKGKKAGAAAKKKPKGCKKKKPKKK